MGTDSAVQQKRGGEIEAMLWGITYHESWLQPGREGLALEMQQPQDERRQTSPLNRLWSLGSKGFKLNN